MGELEDRLRAVPFFRSLPDDDLAAIGGLLRATAIRKNAVLFREGDDADAMYLVESGQLEVLRGSSAKPIARLGAGSVAGELAVLLGEPRSATVQAATASRLWRLTRDDLDHLLASHPAIARELSAELSRRLVTTTRRLTQGDRVRTICVTRDAEQQLRDAVTSEGIGADELLLVPIARSRSAGTAATVDSADWIVTGPGAPAWITARHPRVIELGGTFGSAAAAARRVSGRAVGLAFSSGGSKTVAHIGVVDALRQRGVRIDAVAGSSGGALIAAGVAAGASVAEIVLHTQELAGHLRRRRWDPHIIPRSGILKGRRVRDLFARWFEGRDFADLDLPLYIVASDVVTGEEVVFTEGSIADALRASLSIPAAFDPWRHVGRLLIDGGVTNPLPAGPLRSAGYERVIASNVAGKDVDTTVTSTAKLPSIITVMLRTINLMEAEVIKAHLPLADVVIRPRVHASSSFDFTHMDEFIDEGRAATARQDAELARLGLSQR